MKKLILPLLSLLSITTVAYADDSCSVGLKEIRQMVGTMSFATASLDAAGSVGDGAVEMEKEAITDRTPHLDAPSNLEKVLDAVVMDQNSISLRFEF